MAESLVEKVARALARRDNLKHENWWPSYEGRARAAIEAMREPNDAMVDAAGGELVPCGDFIPAYRAAIRAALNEEVAG